MVGTQPIPVCDVVGGGCQGRTPMPTVAPVLGSQTVQLSVAMASNGVTDLLLGGIECLVWQEAVLLGPTCALVHVLGA